MVGRTNSREKHINVGCNNTNTAGWGDDLQSVDNDGDWISGVEKRIYAAKEEIKQYIEPYKFSEVKRFLLKFFDNHIIWDQGSIGNTVPEEEIGDSAKECYSISETDLWISHRFNHLPSEFFIIKKSEGIGLYSKRAHVKLHDEKREPYVRLSASVYVTYKESSSEEMHNEHKEISISNHNPIPEDAIKVMADDDFFYDITSEVIAKEASEKFSARPEKIRFYRKLSSGYNCTHYLCVHTGSDYMVVDKAEEIVSSEALKNVFPEEEHITL